MIQSEKQSIPSAEGRRYLLPFALITSLFLIWGFAHGLLDVLNKHFQDTLHVSKSLSGLVQFAVYGAYFLMALPAGFFMKKYGFKAGILFGLLLVSAGSFLFLPVDTFFGFLFALFILACGLTFLETAANPYVTVLGDPKLAEQRINLSQSFNGLGWILGPWIGGLLILGSSPDDQSGLQTPYLFLGSGVLLVAILFVFIRLPEIQSLEENTDLEAKQTSLFQNPNFRLAVLAQFLYVAAQTGINSFFINYVTEVASMSEKAASQILAFGGMGLFFVGRLSGSAIMKRKKGEWILSIYAFAGFLLMVLVVVGIGTISVVALFVCYFFMSIMFPTIFALGLRNLGAQTKQGASFLVMAILGGALAPMGMGYIADVSSMQLGFIVPMLCFLFIAWYGRRVLLAGV